MAIKISHPVSQKESGVLYFICLVLFLMLNMPGYVLSQSTYMDVFDRAARMAEQAKRTQIERERLEMQKKLQEVWSSPRFARTPEQWK